MYEKKSESSHQVTFFLQNRASWFDFLMIFACYEKKTVQNHVVSIFLFTFA